MQNSSTVAPPTPRQRSSVRQSRTSSVIRPGHGDFKAIDEHEEVKRPAPRRQAPLAPPAPPRKPKSLSASTSVLTPDKTSLGADRSPLTKRVRIRCRDNEDWGIGAQQKGDKIERIGSVCESTSISGPSVPASRSTESDPALVNVDCKPGRSRPVPSKRSSASVRHPNRASRVENDSSSASKPVVELAEGLGAQAESEQEVARTVDTVGRPVARRRRSLPPDVSAQGTWPRLSKQISAASDGNDSSASPKPVIKAKPSRKGRAAPPPPTTVTRTAKSVVAAEKRSDCRLLDQRRPLVGDRVNSTVTPEKGTSKASVDRDSALQGGRERPRSSGESQSTSISSPERAATSDGTSSSVVSHSDSAFPSSNVKEKAESDNPMRQRTISDSSCSQWNRPSAGTGAQSRPELPAPPFKRSETKVNARKERFPKPSAVLKSNRNEMNCPDGDTRSGRQNSRPSRSHSGTGTRRKWKIPVEPLQQNESAHLTIEGTDVPADLPTEYSTVEGTDVPADLSTEYSTVEGTDVSADLSTEYSTVEGTDVSAVSPSSTSSTPEPSAAPGTDMATQDEAFYGVIQSKLGHPLDHASTDMVVELATEYYATEASDEDSSGEEDIYSTPLYMVRKGTNQQSSQGKGTSSDTTSAKSNRKKEEPGLSEELLAQITMEMQALEGEIKIEKKKQKSLQHLARVVEGAMAIDMGEKLDACNKTLTDLMNEFDTLKAAVEGGGAVPFERHADQRQRVIKELVETERSFIRDMEHCCAGFMVPLRDKTPGLVNVKMLFGNIEQVVEVSRQFLTSLEEATNDIPVADVCVGPCFLKMNERWNAVYTEYCRNHDDASDLLVKAKLENNERVLSTLVELGEELKTMHNSKVWDLNAFLIKPVQRILKYPLLIRELRKNTEHNHPDKKELKSAGVMIDGIAHAINEFKRRKDIVTKYRKSQEKNEESDRMRKFTLHSLLKKADRLTQKIGQATGLTSSTVDWRFDEEISIFHLLDKTAKQLVQRLHEHIRSVQEANSCWLRALASLKEVYGKDCSEVQPVFNCFERSAEVVDNYVSMLRTQIGERAQQLCGMFQSPQFFIMKRNDKLLDYDSCKNRADKLKSDTEKLKEFKDELTSKKREYEAINAQLLDDLPKFTDLAIRILSSIGTAWQAVQWTYASQWLLLLEPLKMLDIITDDSNTLTSKEIVAEHQTRLIELHTTWCNGHIIPGSFLNRLSDSVTLRQRRQSSRGSLISRSSSESVAAMKVNLKAGGSHTSPLVQSPVQSPVMEQREITKQSVASENSYDKALVLYDFTKENEGEISVAQGTVVQVLCHHDLSHDTQWWKVKCGNKIGYVPANYLSQDDASLQKAHGQARVAYDFKALNEGELTVTQGEVVNCLDKREAEWAYVQIGGRTGVVPSSYLQDL